MKKLLYLLLLFPCLIQSQITVSGQKATYRNPYPKPIKVEVVQKTNPYQQMQNSITNSTINAIQNAAANNIRASANASANASENAKARKEAMKDRYSKIFVDELINNDGIYKAIVLENVSGWRPEENRETILEILNSSNKMRFFEKRKSIPKSARSSNQILYLSWNREHIGNYSRITKVSIKDYQNQVVYEAIHKNMSFIEMLLPLTSKYVFNKEMLIQKLKELQELKELEIISKEDFDSYVQKYKLIILKGF
jgi:hypothetical protein